MFRLTLPALFVAAILATPTHAELQRPGIPAGFTATDATRFGDLVSSANKAVTAGQHAKAARLLRQATRLHGGNESTWYNLACVLALTGDAAAAQDALESAAIAGWRDAEWPAEDTDLSSLHGTPAFLGWTASLGSRGPTAAATWPAASELPQPAASEAAMEEQAEAWEAALTEFRPLMGPSSQRGARLALAAWRAASWDRIAAGTTDADARAEAEYAGLRAVAGKDARYLSATAAAEVQRRSDAFVALHPDSARVPEVRLAAAEAAHALAVAADGGEEVAERARKEFERALLLLTTTTAEGPAVESALLRLLGMNADGPAAPLLHSRLASVIGDADKLRERLTASYETRGVHFRMNGLPAFEATTLDGRAVTASSLPGRVTMLDFWATWCGPCRAELPNLKAAYEQLHERGFEIVGISLDSQRDKTPEALQAWCAENGMPWPQVYDGLGWKAAVAQTFGVHSIPFPLLVDSRGKVLASDDELRGDRLVPTLERYLGSADSVGAQ